METTNAPVGLRNAHGVENGSEFEPLILSLGTKYQPFPAGMSKSEGADEIARLKAELAAARARVSTLERKRKRQPVSARKEAAHERMYQTYKAVLKAKSSTAWPETTTYVLGAEGKPEWELRPLLSGETRRCKRIKRLGRNDWVERAQRLIGRFPSLLHAGRARDEAAVQRCRAEYFELFGEEYDGE